VNNHSAESLYEKLNVSLFSVGNFAVEFFLPEKKLLIGVRASGQVFISAPEMVPMNGFSFDTGSLHVHQKISLPNGEIISPNFMLECKIENSSDLLAISSLFSGLVDLALSDLEEDSLCEAVLGLRNFFNARDREIELRKIEIGLAGELVVILGSEDIDSMVTAWHSSAVDTFDFVFNGCRLEVKTSTSPQRIHNLRMSQNNNDVADLTYASVHCVESGNGKNLSELRDEIVSRLEVPYVSTFLKKCEEYDFEIFEMKFDTASAIEGIRLIPSHQVPAPQFSDPAILEISWKCNFSLIDSVHDVDSWLI
jgi:hypothetical protein